MTTENSKAIKIIIIIDKPNGSESSFDLEISFDISIMIAGNKAMMITPLEKKLSINLNEERIVISVKQPWHLNLYLYPGTGIKLIDFLSLSLMYIDEPHFLHRLT